MFLLAAAFMLGYSMGQSAGTGISLPISAAEEPTPVMTPLQLDSENNRYTADGKLRINLATEEDLLKLPGVGQSTAQKILDYRAKHGDFQAKAELLRVSGIGESKYAKIAPLVTIF